jgi:hypothetical protein
MRRARVVSCALALLLGVSLAGCADDPPAKPASTIEPRLTASSPSPTVNDSDSEICSLLTSKERASIAGVKLDLVVPVAQKARQCRWVKAGATQERALELAASPAREWVSQLPTLIERMVRTGRTDAKFSKRLQAAKKKVLRGEEKLGQREVCDMFSLIAEANGGKEGNRTLVYFLPTTTGDFTVSVQTCSQGVHTLLTYSERGLMPSEPLSDALLRLAVQTHKRAIKLF